MNAMSAAQDGLLRAMTDDGAFRVITCVTTTTVRAAIAAQKAEGAVASRFGDLLTGAILVRETMSPGQRVQGVLKGAAGTGSFVADSDPDGTTRGLVMRPKGKSDVTFGDGALLQMMRTMQNGALARGVVEVPERGGVSGALMAYMQESEQVLTSIAVATRVDGADVSVAGGYVVQLLPELSEGMLMVMTERLADFEPVDALLARSGTTPLTMVEELLYGMPFTLLEERPLSFGCKCSAERLLASLATLDRREIEELVAAGELLEIGCDYCGRNFELSPQALRGLLTAS